MISENVARPRARRQFVESCLTLDVGQLLRRGVLAPGSRTRGVISWLGPTGEVASSVSYEADMVDPNRSWLRLRFSTPLPNGPRRQVDQRVALSTTRPRFGGVRWWFVDGTERLGRLHLPAGGDRFRSRRAHRLVYASQYSVRPGPLSRKPEIERTSPNDRI
jgi:hypothetical protein